MSGAGQAVPAAQPADFSTLTEAAVLMQEAALEAGVERGTPLEVWVQAMVASMIAFGETAAEQRYAITNSLRDGRALVEAELQRVRETEQLARTAIEEAKYARIVTQLEKEQVIREMTRTVSSGVIGTVIDVVKARARLHDRREGLLSWIDGAAGAVPVRRRLRAADVADAGWNHDVMALRSKLGARPKRGSLLP